MFSCDIIEIMNYDGGSDMKIELCEQAMQSWLQHIKGCQIVQTNWMVSPLFDIDPFLPYVEWFMEDITEKLNDEIDEQTRAELALSNAKEIIVDSGENLEFNPAEGIEFLSNSFLSAFAVLNKSESKAIKNIFGKSTPKQFITQCEIDLVGVKLNTGEDVYKSREVEKIYIADSAFHKGTLGYSDAPAVVLKKLIRACVVSKLVFGSKLPVEIIFSTPDCRPGLENKLYDLVQILRDLLKKHYSPDYDNVNIELYINRRFADEIYLPLRNNIDDLNNDNDLFMRAMNLAKVAEKRMTGTPSVPAKKASGRTPAGKTASAVTSRAASLNLTYEMAAHYISNTDSMKKVGTLYLPTPDTSGNKTQSRLLPLGILGEHKGMLIGSDIDTEIAAATGLLKNTLEEIKRRGLV